MPKALKIPKHRKPIDAVLWVMNQLRAPHGCPWDREQDHRSLRLHAIEEVYELLDAIEAGDDHEMLEELGDLLLQVVFHCQLAQERQAFGFDQVARTLADKLIRRHPHVFGESSVDTVDGVWAQWDRIKHAEKAGTPQARPSALDGIPRHLPALLRAEKLAKKARKAGLLDARQPHPSKPTRRQVAAELFALAQYAQERGWSAEALLLDELKKQERAWRKSEQKKTAHKAVSSP
jgi:uncharacterized protein YabN with tetrapyrrole methylase and pyrophosphatase domain